MSLVYLKIVNAFISKTTHIQCSVYLCVWMYVYFFLLKCSTCFFILKVHCQNGLWVSLFSYTLTTLSFIYPCFLPFCCWKIVSHFLYCIFFNYEWVWTSFYVYVHILCSFLICFFSYWFVQDLDIFKSEPLYGLY